MRILFRLAKIINQRLNILRTVINDSGKITTIFRIELIKAIHDFLRMPGTFGKNNTFSKLVSPLDSSSLVSGLLKKYKNSPYHICYETDNLETAFADLTSNGFTAIDTPTPAPALDGRKVVFLTSSAIGMVELLAPAQASS